MLHVGTADARMARLKLTFYAPWGKLPSYVINPREPSVLKKGHSFEQEGG